MAEFRAAGEGVVLVELTDAGLPYQVFADEFSGVHYAKLDRRMYDIEWSRQLGTFVLGHSGGGGLHLSDRRRPYWLAPGTDPATVVVYGDKTGRLTKYRPDPRRRVSDSFLIRPPGKPLRDAFAVCELAKHVLDIETEHCYFCGDWLQVPNGHDRLCRHTSWCDECGMWSSPQERCSHDKRKTVEESRS